MRQIVVRTSVSADINDANVDPDCWQFEYEKAVSHAEQVFHSPPAMRGETLTLAYLVEADALLEATFVPVNETRGVFLEYRYGEWRKFRLSNYGERYDPILIGVRSSATCLPVGFVRRMQLLVSSCGHQITFALPLH